jgi:hypothetical protein
MRISTCGPSRLISRRTRGGRGEARTVSVGRSKTSLVRREAGLASPEKEQGQSHTIPTGDAPIYLKLQAPCEYQ